jgi:RNA polymerase sigma-70 factor (ECF subfamily)
MTAIADAAAPPPGDFALFEAAVARCRPALLAHAMRKLGNREAALDCVQEVLVRALESLSRLREGCSPEPWLYGILENVCLEERRRLAKGITSGLMDEHIPAGAFESQAQARDDLLSALKALARLPMEPRVTALLGLVEGLTAAQAAAILQTSEEAVRMRLSRARAAVASAPPSHDGISAARGALAKGYQFLASLLLRQGKQPESDRALMRSLDFDPEAAYGIWGNQVLARGTPLEAPAREQAIRVLREGLKRWPGVALLATALGNLEHWEVGDHATGERLFRSAMNDPGDARGVARLHLADLYSQTGRPHLAMPLLDGLIRERSNLRYDVVFLARALALCGHPAAAEWAQRARSVALRPAGRTRSARMPWIHVGNLRLVAGEVFEMLGNKAEAALSLRAAQRAYPPDYPQPRVEDGLRRCSRSS